MSSPHFRKLGWAVYVIIFLVSILLYAIAANYLTNQLLQNFLINCSAGFLVIALVFFLVNLCFSYDPEKEKEEEEKSELKKLVAEFNLLKGFFSTALERSFGGKYLRGPEEIYPSALRLYKTVEKNIRVIQVFAGPQPPKEYAEAAAKIMKEKKLENKRIVFEAILFLDISKVPSDFVARVQERQKIYTENDVGEQVFLKLFDMKDPVGMTVFIVDRKHAHISFPTVQTGPQLETSIEFENNPGLASDMADWFDKIVYTKGILFKDWQAKK